MIAFLKFLGAVALVGLLGFCAWRIEAAPGSAASAQHELERRARGAIGAEDSAWASVRMDGQKAILSGEAPDEARREALIARINEAEWSGGLALGGVTAIDANGLTIAAAAPLADPYIFIAEHESGVVSFSGSVPDQASRDRLYGAVNDHFPGAEIAGALDIAEGAPVGAADWTLAAQTSLRALAQLRRGAAQSEDAAFTLTGEADDEMRVSAARALMNALPEGLTGTIDVRIRPAPASIGDIIAQADEAEEDPAEAPALEPAAEIAEAAPEPATPAVPSCLAQLEQSLNAHKIGFGSARTDIDNRSREHLREIASIVADCPSAQLRITGHTDSSGNAARNRQLSGYRADAVRTFLISVGAPADRLTTRGAGSSEPIADNSTPAGRERNRRIDIDLIAEE